jgi:hypothetical protein
VINLTDFDLENYVITSEEWGLNIMPPKFFEAADIQRLLSENINELCAKLTDMFGIVCQSMYNYDRFKFNVAKKYYIVVDTDSGKWYIAC